MHFHLCLTSTRPCIWLAEWLLFYSNQNNRMFMYKLYQTLITRTVQHFDLTDCAAANKQSFWPLDSWPLYSISLPWSCGLWRKGGTPLYHAVTVLEHILAQSSKTRPLITRRGRQGYVISMQSNHCIQDDTTACTQQFSEGMPTAIFLHRGAFVMVQHLEWSSILNASSKQGWRLTYLYAQHPVAVNQQCWVWLFLMPSIISAQDGLFTKLTLD